MEYTELLAGRRSTRHFDTSREVPDEPLAQVLAAPLAMPHAGNTYDWRGVVLRAGGYRCRPRRDGDRMPARRSGQVARIARRRRPLPVRDSGPRLARRRGRSRRRAVGGGAEAAGRRDVLLGAVGRAVALPGVIIRGLRDELAELVAARGLSRLDAGLGPVETKLEILAVLAGVGCGDRLRRLCLDGAGRAPVVVPATAAITRVPVRNGHRVGALAFSGEAVPGAAAVAFAGAAAGRAISLRPRHQHRGGIEAARLLVLREAAAGARQHVILVSDAECTSHNGSDEAWGPAGAPRGSQLIPWRMSGGVVDVARRAALIAASRCRRQRITVSVAHPDLRAQVGFADQLAEAGGGRARCLRSA